MKILISHLEKINAKLQASKPMDQDSYDEFIRLFCNDFWDKIREYTPTAGWLKSRVIYMDSLSKREDIIGLQKSLIEMVRQMRSLVCKKEYTDTLLKTRNLKAYHYLGAGYNSANNEEQHKDDLFSLAEEALDVSSFTMFGDENVPYFWESKAQSRLFPTGKLFDQYSKAKKVIDVLAVISKESTNPIDEETLNKLRDKYGSILKDLEYELRITPLSLHCIDYEELALLHAGYTPNSYYPEYYKNSLKLHWDNGRTYLKEIKESIDRAMDDIRLSSDYIKDTYDEYMSSMSPKADNGIALTAKTKDTKSEKSLTGIWMPAGTKWEGITITFTDGHTVSITGNKILKKCSYEAMGFQDKRKMSHNQQWELLKLLAENNGELSGKSKAFDYKNMKRAEELAKTLKKFFKIEGSPLHHYKIHKAIKVKFTLIPESDKEMARTHKPVDEVETPYSDLQTLYTEQTPGIYENNT